MGQEIPLNRIRSFVELFIRQWPEVFLVDVSASPSNKVTVLLDADTGMNVGKCAEVNRALYKLVEEEKLFNENNFSLEVSSPGIDRPLKLLRQFVKNVGRTVEVTKTDSSIVEGKLVQAEEEGITIEKTEKKKKKEEEVITLNIPFTEIRQVKVLVIF